ncbi:alanine racemase [Salisediminibacterium halotolerans]|uniref:alanine racemase n=1 Tax=Salisediminibacterium halotolerans TaxID=517425 RepID=UPI000EAE4BA5|nr:alanine racemase [Salisediminibacterium halotolerans]RLJ73295.1 alanine racemase [Actinophytocola xinjiangensis]RPE86717.1 alanine racemase [Salisediminibacterium halotolerans]TWG34092.1 alanine racemase [Salisediminibacterium halotolerans]GEL07606.1 alanine racemase [Salisediminibacterium halotolerans]
MDKTESFFRDTWAEVNLDAIRENVMNIKAGLPGKTAFMAVVKANGYGHGAFDIATDALQAGAEFLGVSMLDEAISLRRSGISAPILVMGLIRPRDITVAAKWDVAVTAFQEDWLAEAEAYLEKSGSRISCHVKLDSGMGRLGLRTPAEAKSFAKKIKGSANFTADGLYTHMATADELDTAYFDEQVKRADELVGAFEEAYGSEVGWKHCSNSATALRFALEKYNLVRVGISMYGLAPSPEIKPVINQELKEAFSLHSKITHVKKVAAGEGISYGATYQTEGEEWIATVPIGYADGWIRKNQHGDVLVNGKRAPIVGRICMDQMMIRLEEPVDIGTTVTLIGENGGAFLPMDEVAARLETINYEIPCTITPRVPRCIIRGGKVTVVHNSVF